MLTESLACFALGLCAGLALNGTLVGAVSSGVVRAALIKPAVRLLSRLSTLVLGLESSGRAELELQPRLSASLARATSKADLDVGSGHRLLATNKASTRASLSDRQLMLMYDTAFSSRSLLNLQAPQATWMNFGLWRRPHQTFQEACEALAHALGEAMRLSPADVLVDVGCGCADQDVHFARAFGVGRICGVEIAPSQVMAARAKIQRLQLQTVVSVQQGSATALPFEPSSATKVSSLDSAYHYATRESFFREAHRVLQPSGVLGLVDICLSDDWAAWWAGYLPSSSGSTSTLASPAAFGRVVRRWASWLLLRIVCIAFALPVPNLYTQDVYEEKLAACGFANMAVEDLSGDVFEGFANYIDETHASLRDITVAHEWVKFRAAAWFLRFAHRKRIAKCILVTASKR